MENLSLASKVLLDKSYLHLKKEIVQFKKDVARRLFYHKIDLLLRDANKKFVKCKCKQCTDLIHHNYPEVQNHIIISLHAQPPPETDPPQINENQIYNETDNQIENDDVTLDNETINEMNEINQSHEDENHENTIFPLSTFILFRSDLLAHQTIPEECELEHFFISLCKKHKLPIPIFDKGNKCLWKKLGHQQNNQVCDIENKSWRNQISKMSYYDQIEKVYKGLMNDLVQALDQTDSRPIFFIKKKNTPFEDWFRFKSTSLLVSDFETDVFLKN